MIMVITIITVSIIKAMFRIISTYAEMTIMVTNHTSTTDMTMMSTIVIIVMIMSMAIILILI